MCLGVPGEILDIVEPDAGLSEGTVSFGGIRKKICLAYVPDAHVGDYVVVHAGFALTVIDAERAREFFTLLEEGSIDDEVPR